MSFLCQVLKVYFPAGESVVSKKIGQSKISDMHMRINIDIFLNIRVLEKHCNRN